MHENGKQTDARKTAKDRDAVIGGLDITIINETVENISGDVFAKLGPRDVLFIDSSHILMPGSDVDYLCNRILPGLKPGVVIHIHDIFLPDDYPADWAWRGYNEQLAFATLLQGGGYEVLFSSHYGADHAPELLAGSVVERLPLGKDAVESSLWLKKRA